MFVTIQKLVNELVSNFDSISLERKLVLEKLSIYIQQKVDSKSEISLVYICTHNSRRSIFGQIAASVAAEYYTINNVKTFSGGTEATEFNQNAINALIALGFKISTSTPLANLIYNVNFSGDDFVVCFSKLYDHHKNPFKNFAAVITCSDAEQNCPFVLGAEIRVATTYQDPKILDGLALQNQTYIERFKQIATETLYVFSLLKS